MAPKLAANYAEATSIAIEIISLECERRYQEVYRNMRVFPQDDAERQQDKAGYCIEQLHHYADKPLDFVRDFGWSPDPRGLFGGKGRIPEHLAPAGMVPLMLSPAQAQFLQEVVNAMLSDEDVHINLLKSRQLACTTMVLFLFIWAILFLPGFTIGICSYEEKQIDPGGSGHRTADALFPRMRMMFDAIAWAVPELAFNQHEPDEWQEKTAKGGNKMLFRPSQDARFKIIRPRWEVYKRHMFPRAETNYIRGAPPSEKFLQGDICTVILLDEYGLFRRPTGIDKATRDSVLQSCSTILTQGTIPEGGGLDSHFKKLHDQGNENSTLVNIELCWSDVERYMLLAEFKCPNCEKISAYGKPQPGPGTIGRERVCAHCAQIVLVKRFTADSIPVSEAASHDALQPGEVTSPWWLKRMAANSFDRVAISRFFLRDWMASVGDRAFYTYDASRALCARTPEKEEEEWRSIDGFDPGWSSDNPAAWMLVRFSDTLMIPRVVAWHMAENREVQWWVPFFNRWSPERMHRSVVNFGPHAGEQWVKAYHYTPDELDILARIARYPRRIQHDEVQGDKYGGNLTGVGISEYKILSDYGIEVNYEYTVDRENLVATARDLWVSRMEIDLELKEYRPESKTAAYPSLSDCFSSARMRTTLAGQGEPKRDIDKNNPKHVSHPIDAFLYACRSMPDDVHAVADIQGDFAVTGVREARPVFFGEQFEGQF